MKHLSVSFIIIFSVCVLSNCSPPIGSINGNAANGFDTLVVIPNRLFYEKGDPFNPQDDLQILTSDNGLVRKVDPYETGVTIEISEISSFGDPVDPALVNGSVPYYFPLPGIYRIDISYNNRTGYYTIEVRGYYVEPGDGSDFIEIIWL